MTIRPQRSSKPRLEAVAAYESAHLVALDLVARIDELLHDRPAPDDQDAKIHWGHVGDTNYVNARLSEIIAFLSGREP